MAKTLSSLLSSTSIEDHDEVFKAANATLKLQKGDLGALHSRVVALIKLDRYSDAIRSLDEGGDKLATRCALERAYALYKTGNLEEAEKLAASSDRSRGLKHVAAQVAYRAEKFEDAAKIYKALSAGGAIADGEENDLRINSAAVDAQLQWAGKGDLIEPSRRTPDREDLEAFETTYNAACGYVARGELGYANVLLQRARHLCEALDWASEHEMKAEVLPIMVQQSYVLTRLGKFEEALELQNLIKSEDVPEAPTKVIAQNNSIAASAHDNPFIAQRLFESVPTLSKSDKLFEYQSSALQRNRLVSDLQAFKGEGVARSTGKMLSKSTSSTTSSYLNGLSSLNAIAHIHTENHKTSLKQVLPLLEKRPNDVGLLLVIIQLYVLSGNTGSAITLLESFFKKAEESSSTANQDVRFTPGLVALAVSLYKSQGRRGPLRTELSKAASYWHQKAQPSDSLLRAAGVALLDSTNPEELQEASEIFSSIQKQASDDKVALAGLVAASATTNFAAIENDVAKLRPVSQLISGIDASALEEQGIVSLPVVKAEIGKKRSAPVETEKPKKRHTSKLPKDFEEGKLPDPERWLPLKDRSSYRPKGKKGKKKALDSTQGGVVREEDMADVSATASVVKPQQPSNSKNKKKKGKK